MPRYFFHVYDDISAEDEEGLDLASPEKAVACAVRAARELAADEVKNGKLNLSHRVEVTNETGAKIAAVRFRDCVEIEH